MSSKRLLGTDRDVTARARVCIPARAAFAGTIFAPGFVMKISSLLAALLLGGVALTISPVGCALQCTEIGCTTVVAASVTVDGGVAPLEGASARVCREDQCVDAGFVVNLDQASCEVVSNDDFSVSCQVSPEGAISFSVSLFDQDADDEEAYSFTVNASDGSELGAVAGDVTYEKTEINGDGCGYCYAGSL